MRLDQYSALKFLHHPDRIEQLRDGKQIVPVSVHWDLCSWCPQACSFCAYRMPGYTTSQLFSEFDEHGQRRMVTLEKAREILDDFSSMGVRGVEFTGGGEPTAHPNFFHIASCAFEKGLDVALVTNGVLLTDDSAELLAARGTWVRFSIDAATESTYTHMRCVPPIQWERAITNLRNLCSRKAASLVVGVGFVVNRENWREIVAAAELAKDCGADNIRISAVFQQAGANYFDEFRQPASELCHTARELASESFRVFDLFSDRIADLEQGPPDYQRCIYQEFVTYIGGDLSVYRCCNLAFSDRGKIGSLSHQSFRTLWESESKRRAFYGFDAHGCPRCMFNKKNRAMSYAVVSDPQHVNFV